MKLTQRQVQDLGHRHSPAARDAVVAAGRWDANGAFSRLEIEMEAFRAALKTAGAGSQRTPVAPGAAFKSPAPVKVVQIAAPVPEGLWPLWAKAVKALARPEDAGVGDTVARVIGPANSAAFKAWYLAAFQKTCGCGARQQEWNAKYPYLFHVEHF